MFGGRKPMAWRPLRDGMRHKQQQNGMNNNYTYRALWQRLQPVYDEREAKAVVGMVLEERFGLTLTDIVCGGVEALGSEQCEELEQMMRRLETGEPVQYVLGSARFCGRSFRVEPATLIPRPETEQLVGMVSDFARRMASPAILDVGTGTGCVATSVALECPAARVTAWDISEEALRVARGNALRLGAEVDFCRQDALCPPALDEGKWDAIVSNPPYVMEKERAAMAVNVLRYEPSLALFVPDGDPLRFYRALAVYGRKALKDGGGLFFEINPLQAAPLASLLEEEGYREVAILADAFGKQRFAQAIK